MDEIKAMPSDAYLSSVQTYLGRKRLKKSSFLGIRAGLSKGELSWVYGLYSNERSNIETLYFQGPVSDVHFELYTNLKKDKIVKLVLVENNKMRHSLLAPSDRVGCIQFEARV